LSTYLTAKKQTNKQTNHDDKLHHPSFYSLQKRTCPFSSPEEDSRGTYVSTLASAERRSSVSSKKITWTVLLMGARHPETKENHGESVTFYVYN